MEGQKPQSKSDEIDLGQLFSRIGDSIHSGWMGLMRFLALVRRIPLENKVLFSSIVVATVALGIYFTLNVQQTYYESSMVFSSDYLNKRLAENIVDKLDGLAKEKNKSGLARTLDVSDKVADNVVGFEVEPFMAETDVVELEVFKEQLRNTKTNVNQKVIEEVIDRIEVENRHAYQITVRTLKPDVINNLQAGVINHFRTIPYIKKRVEANRENLLDMKTKLSRDVAKLDSLKLVIYESYRELARGRGSNNVILNDKASDPALLYEQGLDIYELYEEVTRDIYLQKDFEVVDGFAEFSSPASASFSMMILYSILAGIFFAYLVIALLGFNSYLANLK